MKTLSQLRKEAKSAPKFVLELQYQDKTCYISERQTISSINLTTDVTKACQFSVGYDDENMKRRAWQMTAKLAGLDTPVTVKYL